MLFYKYQKTGNLDFSMLRQGEIYFASVSYTEKEDHYDVPLNLGGDAEEKRSTSLAW
jgi:hypothetical protein